MPSYIWTLFTYAQSLWHSVSPELEIKKNGATVKKGEIRHYPAAFWMKTKKGVGGGGRQPDLVMTPLLYLVVSIWSSALGSRHPAAQHHRLLKPHLLAPTLRCLPQHFPSSLSYLVMSPLPDKRLSGIFFPLFSMCLIRGKNLASSLLFGNEFCFFVFFKCHH